MEEDGLHITVQATMEHVNVQVSWQSLVGVRLVIAMVVAYSSTITHPKAMVVWSISHALML